MNKMFLLTVAFLLLTLTYLLLKTKKYNSLPSPGLALPLVGHVYKLYSAEAQRDPVNFLWKLYRKYQRNGLVYLKFCTINVVFVGDFETVKYLFNHPDVQLRSTEALKKSSMEERQVKTMQHVPGKRFATYNSTIFYILSSGVFISEGKTWVEQRRFTLRTLRDFGFGKQSMEELIQEEAELFKALLLKNGDEPFDFNNKFNLPILNALWRVTVGERFDYDSPKLLSILQRLTETVERSGKPEAMILIAFPWIKRINPKAFGRDETLSVLHDIQVLITERIRQHQETLGNGSASHNIKS